MAEVQLEQILKRDDVPSDVKQIVMDHLQKNRKEYKRFYESTKELIFKSTPAGQILSVNPAVEDILGYSVAEMREMTVKDIYADQKLSKRKIALEKLMEDGYLNNYEVSFVNKDGALIHGLSNVILVHDEETNERIIESYFRDITKQKHLEKELTREKNRAQHYLDVVGVIILSLNREGRVSLINKKGCELLGYNEEDVIGKNWVDNFIPQRRKAEITKIFDSLMAGTLEPFKYVKGSVLTKDGKEKLVAWNNTVIRDENGAIVSTLSSAEDITERKKAEEELKKFKTIADNAGYGVGIIDMQGDISYANESFAKIHGYATDDLIGRNFSILHIEEQMKNVLQLKEQLEQQGSFIAEEVWHKRKDNTVFPTSMNGTLITDENGTPQFMVATAIDITERKKAEEELRESEEKLRAFMDAATENFSLFDSKLNFIDLNLLAQREINELGIDPNKVIGMNLLDINPTSKETGIYDKFMEVIRTGEPFSGDNMIPDPKFGDRYFSLKAFKVGDGLGLITTDTTERKRAEKTKEDLEKRRSAFVSMTSHELRTPITVIKGYTEFLKENLEKVESIRRSQAIQAISRSVFRLERLIEGVADITRMEKGIFDVKKSVIPFSKFLETSIQPYFELYGNKFSIQRLVESKLPVFLNIDYDRIRQVLDNLLDNANKHTPDDGRIIITSEVLANTIQISIVDTGVGVDPNDLERIFEQFVSIGTELTSSGTGIGLYISKIICEAHGGTLTAHSGGKNQGSTFIVELPQWFEE